MTSDDVVGSIRRWLYEDCLPFWTENGPDRRYGGFVEDFNFDGTDAAREFKRTRVACRQIYVFSHAKLLGWNEGAALIADGVDYLVSKAWMPDQLAFARRLTRDGRMLDAVIDLYDHAFALLAFVWAHRATGDAACLEWAHRTLDSIERHLRPPSGAGFLHQRPAEGWRQQNPHMHLLEASLFAFEFSGDAAFKTTADEILSLFRTKFLQRETGTLAEYFSDDWSLASGDDGRLVEPGHLFEWIWILNKYQKILGVNINAEMSVLADFSEKYGIHPNNRLVLNAVTSDGAILDGGSRTWPNTERVKAGAALSQSRPDFASKMMNESAEILLNKYLTPSASHQIPKGTWIDSFDKNGGATASAIPASTLYHLFLAFAELLRVKTPAAS